MEDLILILLINLYYLLIGFISMFSMLILPILPIILSVGTLKDKKNFWGFILGYILSLTLFRLVLLSIVNATYFSVSIYRYFGMILTFLFGVILIFFPHPFIWLKENFKWSSLKSDLKRGIFLGVAIGFAWTFWIGPASGLFSVPDRISPLLIFITYFFSVGSSLALLLIAYVCSKVVYSSKFLSLHISEVRRFFGYLMILIAAFLAVRPDINSPWKEFQRDPPFNLHENYESMLKNSGFKESEIHKTQKYLELEKEKQNK